jgi:hypothetical protein
LGSLYLSSHVHQTLVAVCYLTGFPIDKKMVNHAVDSKIVCLYGSWPLGMAHFNESGMEDLSGLAVDVDGANFGFGGRGHDIAKDAAFSMYAAVVGRLLVLTSRSR